MKQRLSLPDDLYPVEAFFNVLTDASFVKALSSFAEGWGYNPEDKTCDFPNDLVEEEGGPPERFSYIEVWTYANNQEVRVSFNDFSKYLVSALEAQILSDPSNAELWKAAGGKAVATLKGIDDAHLRYISTQSS
ncbi:hypothetical protein [uncultured Litoreibacter sp.]|uniref:hypothetical protein n=1 Tax=uncultured Litoreibacter sp. TaxID=1392394 RepID=UPI0026116FFF|nr:hypothetical protein [uncultured Litoreibacter sp.]